MSSVVLLREPLGRPRPSRLPGRNRPFGPRLDVLFLLRFVMCLPCIGSAANAAQGSDLWGVPHAHAVRDTDETLQCVPKPRKMHTKNQKPGAFSGPGHSSDVTEMTLS